MCGLNFTMRGPRVAAVMAGEIWRRGLPGRTGIRELSPSAAMSHVRLPIQGLSDEFDQPYEYGPWVVCFVGEVFNFRELEPGARSDVEVVAKRWAEQGLACFDEFEGFWACVFYDRRDNTTYVVTDYLAQKPLYYHPDTRSVSSEIRALAWVHEHEFGKPPELDRHYFSSVEKWGYDRSHRTPFNGIIKLPHGTLTKIFADGTTTVETYVDLKPRPEIDVRKAIERAVMRRLVSDVPVSVLASGGLDSTIVLKLALLHTDDVRVFHVENDEAEFLEFLDLPSGIKVQKLQMLDPEIGPEQFLNEVLDANEGPVDLGSVIPQFLLFEAVRDEGYSVALTGDGADELFGGYRRSADYDSQYSDVFEELVHYHLPRLDKLSMWHTVEYRSPFLSREVVEGALAWPRSQRINKSGLRELFRDLVPGEIRMRPKVALKAPAPRRDKMQWVRDLSLAYQDMVVGEQR